MCRQLKLFLPDRRVCLSRTMWRKKPGHCQHDPGSWPHSRWQHSSIGGLAVASEAAPWGAASVRGRPGSSVLGAHGCTLFRRVRRRDPRHLLSRATQSDGSLSTHGPKHKQSRSLLPPSGAGSQPRAPKCKLRGGLGGRGGARRGRESQGRRTSHWIFPL